MNPRRFIFTGLILAAALMSVACTHTVKVEPIEVKPITLNINIKIDRELDNFFDYEKAAATQPAAQGDHP